MPIEIWLNQADDKFRFSVIPPTIGVSSGISTSSSSIIKTGELVAFSGRKLSTFDIDCFFPNQDYNFCEYYGFPKPYDCVDKLKRWMDEGWILRLIVTETNINMECIITDFDYEEKDATGDVYYSLSLKEYKRFKMPLADIPGNGDVQETQKTDNNNNQNSTGQQQQQRTHTVKKGDTLWGLAKKYYGSGSKYPVIFNANKNLIKNPDVIKDGWKLVIP